MYCNSCSGVFMHSCFGMGNGACSFSLFCPCASLCVHASLGPINLCHCLSNRLWVLLSLYVLAS